MHSHRRGTSPGAFIWSSSRARSPVAEERLEEPKQNAEPMDGLPESQSSFDFRKPFSQFTPTEVDEFVRMAQAAYYEDRRLEAQQRKKKEETDQFIAEARIFVQEIMEEDRQLRRKQARKARQQAQSQQPQPQTSSALQEQATSTSPESGGSLFSLPSWIRSALPRAASPPRKQASPPPAASSQSDSDPG